MVSVCLPSDALSQHLLSYLGFCYLGRAVSLHGYFSKAQLLFLTLDEGYLLTAAPPDLEHGVVPLGPLHSRRWLDVGLLFSAAAPDLRRGVARLATAPDLGNLSLVISPNSALLCPLPETLFPQISVWLTSDSFSSVSWST